MLKLKKIFAMATLLLVIALPNVAIAQSGENDPTGCSGPNCNDGGKATRNDGTTVAPTNNGTTPTSNSGDESLGTFFSASDLWCLLFDVCEDPTPPPPQPSN